jgi:protein-disulfide isomerase
MQHYGDDLAVVSLPVPLNSACNSTVRQNHANHANACELARIAIATWRVNPSKFTKFHCWLFESNFARTPHAARTYAARLVGAKKLNAELAKPYASQYIAKHVQLYQRAGAGAVPKLMFPRSTMVGQVTSSSTLTNMIEKELGPGSRVSRQSR